MSHFSHNFPPHAISFIHTKRLQYGDMVLVPLRAGKLFHYGLSGEANEPDARGGSLVGSQRDCPWSVVVE